MMCKVRVGRGRSGRCSVYFVCSMYVCVYVCVCVIIERRKKMKKRSKFV